MISVEQALEQVTAGVRLTDTEEVDLADALGRVLAEDLQSNLTLPPADVSSMDGYAVRSADVASPPATLTRIGESAAGGSFDGTVGPGQTVRIFTGAPLPDGADAIVIQEDTDVDGDAVTMKETAPVGRFVRPAGLDFKQGDVLLKAGTVLTGRNIGLAAAMNHARLPVRRRPRVAVLATGNELVMPGDAVGPNQIVSSNSIAVASYVKALGGEPVDLGIARDTVESLLEKLEGARGCDLLITIGGASVGDYDLVGQVLGEEGMDLTFYKIAMRPGKPMIFGQLGEVPVLGLPGNPVSAGVTCIVFLRPALQVMLGIYRPDESGTASSALLGRDLKENNHRQDYLRAVFGTDSDGNLTATPYEKQDSSMMALFSDADCLVVRPPQAPAARQGERVEVIPLKNGMVSI